MLIKFSFLICGTFKNGKKLTVLKNKLYNLVYK